MADKHKIDNKGGRPKLEDGAKRNKRLTIKFNAFEMEYININATSAGKKTAVYCREVLIGNHVKARFPKVILDGFQQLYGIANNVNQIAHRANEAGYTDVAKTNTQVCKTVVDFIKYIRGL